MVSRRADRHKEDPLEELSDVYQEVEELESQIKKAVNIGGHVIQSYEKLHTHCGK